MSFGTLTAGLGSVAAGYASVASGFGTATSGLQGGGSAVAALDILSTSSISIPGSLNLLTGSPLGSARSYKLRLVPPGPDQAFTGYQIGLLNPSTSTPYNVKYLSVGRWNDTTLTENPATGHVTLVSTDTPIPAGTDAHPVTGEALFPGAWETSIQSITPSGTNGIRVAIELGANHPRCHWGTFPGHQGPGWVATFEEVLPGSLSSSWSLTGGSEAYNELPLLYVKWHGLTTSIVTLYGLGDSHPNGIGDNDAPYTPYGIFGRMNARWRSAGVRIGAINVARVGHTTDQFRKRLQFVREQFGARIVAHQGFSINNISQSIPYAQFRTDWVSSEDYATAQGMTLLPFLGAGANGIVDHPEDWWTLMKAEQDWLIARRSNTQTGARTTLINQSTGGYGGGLVYSDGGHPNNAGHAQWETDSHAGFKSAIDTLAGVTL